MLIHITTSSPPYRLHQAEAAERLKRGMAPRPSIARLIDAAAHHSGIETRHVVAYDAAGGGEKAIYSTDAGAPVPGTRERMAAYERWARSLSRDAAGRLLEETGCDPSTVHRLITVSCTGFFAPGIDSFLVTELGIPASAQRTHIGFMGCAAALVGFTSVIEALRAAEEEKSTTLLVSVELCSLHLQTTPTRDNILGNMIFADGCAAALFSRASTHMPRLHLLKTCSHLFPDSSDYMGWKVGDTGFELKLSSELPRILSEAAIPVLEAMFVQQGIPRDAIRHWVLHPGGRAILDALQDGLRLRDDEAYPSRAVLRNYGNMSSASILFVMKDLLATRVVARDEVVCAIAFGPGLTMEVAFLRGV